MSKRPGQSFQGSLLFSPSQEQTVKHQDKELKTAIILWDTELR